MVSTSPRIVTEPLGGGSLTRLAVAVGDTSPWFRPAPRTAAHWAERMRAVARDASPGWRERLSLAFGATGAARARLDRIARDGGVLITTGQQPGLFGGPIYTWSKAVSALALADELEAATGIPTAPVFWAATDDADFQEGATTWIATSTGADELAMPRRESDGVPMAETPLGNVGWLLDRLGDGAGSAVDPSVIDVARLAYHPGATVGGAYLTLLRTLLEPLGVAVLDASHPALLEEERPVLIRALERGEAIASALAERAANLRAAGHVPQVADVEGLSLVFSRLGGAKTRVPLRDAPAVIARATSERLSPNVLLRPIVERIVLPTVAYVAGPGELGYFAQVGAVAAAMDTESPLAVPRWSCTIVEPHVDELLGRLGVAPDELAAPHDVERRLAKATIAPEIIAALEAVRTTVSGAWSMLEERLGDHPGLLDGGVVEGASRQMTWRVDHVERRLVRSAKRRETELMRNIAVCRGALFPGGKRQERALNFLPLLARYGPSLLADMHAAALVHAKSLVEPSLAPSD